MRLNRINYIMIEYAVFFIENKHIRQMKCATIKLTREKKLSEK